MELMWNVIKAVILGIVEGITEWLPISSTGHMILVDEFLQLQVSPDFKTMFFVVIQLGAILAVCVLYFKKLNPFAPSKSKIEKKRTWHLWFKVLVAIIPVGIMGLLLDDWFDEHFYNFQTVGLMLIVYGVLFIVIENWQKDKTPKINSFRDMTYLDAFYIGLFQILALVPGTSRSGATIVGAMLLGTSRLVATEFSFFLGIPVMFGASFLKIVKFLLKGNVFTGAEITILLVGMVTAFVVSVLAIKFLMGYLKKNDFKAFGYYRIVLGAIVILYWVAKMMFA